MKYLKLKLAFILSISMFNSFSQSTVTLPSDCANKNLNDYLTNGVCTTNIVVPSGEALTVSGLVRMATNTKIILEPGAVLYMVDATLTHANDASGTSLSCSNFWYGIIAKGDPAYGQENELYYVCHNMDCIDPEFDGDQLDNIGCCYQRKIAHHQAIVYLYNSKIRYSYVGISAGDESFLLNQGSYYSAPQGTQGGAVLYIKNSFFENNFETALTFAPYQNFQQLSTIQGNTFTSQFNNGYQLAKTDGTFLQIGYIKANLNSFKYDISSNSFSYTKTTNYIYEKQHFGVLLYSSDATIKNNTFTLLEDGVRLMGGVSRFVRRPVISDNTFSSNVIGIFNESGEALSAKKNTFIISSGVPYSPSAIGVYAIYPTLQSINQNLYYNLSSKKKDNWGIDIVGNGFTSNNVLYNAFYKVRKGFHSERNNRNLQLSCNNFLQIFDNDINIYSGSTISNQGSAFLPNGNKFSTMSSGQWNILNGGTPFTYYYGTTPAENPILKYNVTTLQAASNNTCPTLYDWYLPPQSKCSKYTYWQVSEMVTGGGTIKGVYNTYSNSLTSIEAGGVQPNETDEYNRVVNAYDMTLADLIGAYSDIMLSDSIPDSTYNDTIVNTLINHKTFTGKYLLLQYYLAQKNFSSITPLLSLLRTLYSENDDVLEYCDYMDLMAEYAQSEYSTTWLKSNFSALKTIADGSGVMSVDAQILTQAAVDCDDTNPYYGTFLYQWLPQDTIWTPPTDTSGIDVTIYPNPFTSTTSVDITNTKSFSRAFSILLKDVQGNIVDIQPKTVGIGATETVVLSSGSSPTGYYYVYIEENSTVVYYGLVYKN
jgi:hypothetical protein